uniref:Uncharacterized protein n=1 Tax=viral metagenome TaxID=1070528 RepID=A0A6C0ISG7_9ZZZZ
MSTLENLISETNKQLLWEVLIDELKIASISQQTLSNIRIVFDKNLTIFRNKSNPSDQLIHLNKQFLKIMVIAVNKLFPNLKQERRIKKINISDEQLVTIDTNINANILYKAEDIQQSRQAQLENLYNQKKDDFEQYTQVNKPKNLDFSDHISEEKITSMDNLLANAMAQRNADLQTIDNTYFNSQNNTTNVNNWLQSEETSNRLKQENSNSNLNNNMKLKHINIDSFNNDTNNKKKVSWINELESENTINIFSKLKKVEPAIEEKQSVYETQTSIPLPIVQPNTSNTINNTNIITNTNDNVKPTPILTNSQIVKQLNDMNSKLDKLFALIETLVEQKNTNNNIDLLC